MQFNVARLLKGVVGATKTYTLNASLLPLEDTQTDRVQGRFKLVRTDSGIWVSGAVVASARFTCARCLQEAPVSVPFQMDDVYYPTVDVNTGVPGPLPEDAEQHCTIDSHHVLDITESVRQYTMVNLPMIPLCRADCAGLCPHCGANLNAVTCSCEPEQADPRWRPLLELASFAGERSERS